MIYLLWKKNEIFLKLKEYIKFNLNNFSKEREALKRDNGGENVKRKIEEHLRQKDIHYQKDNAALPFSKGSCRDQKPNINFVIWDYSYNAIGNKSK